MTTKTTDEFHLREQHQQFEQFLESATDQQVLDKGLGHLATALHLLAAAGALHWAVKGDERCAMIQTRMWRGENGNLGIRFFDEYKPNIALVRQEDGSYKHSSEIARFGADALQPLWELAGQPENEGEDPDGL